MIKNGETMCTIPTRQNEHSNNIVIYFSFTKDVQTFLMLYVENSASHRWEFIYMDNQAKKIYNVVYIEYFHLYFLQFLPSYIYKHTYSKRCDFSCVAQTKTRFEGYERRGLGNSSK